MFYEQQPEKNKKEYKAMLQLIGELSRLFSDSDCPYLPYRAQENIFCKCLKADNLARFDCSADAKKEAIGIGLKTWMGGNDQKIAEFGKLKERYADLTGIRLVKAISEYRNERIRVTKNIHGIDEMIYHIVKRIPNSMQIFECAFDPIDIENISLINNRGNKNNTYFTDGKHTYHFSVSKNTLYMLFEENDMQLLDSFNVNILGDPYSVLIESLKGKEGPDIFVEIPNMRIPLLQEETKERLCIRLYSENNTRGKFVAEKSGLNQWNAGGRRRDADEVYIPYLRQDRERNPNFFPPRDTHFTLHLPDGTEVVAKVCQEADPNDPTVGKSIMSSPNRVLGHWLLRDVFELQEGTIVTYEMLERFGIDCVIFTKNDELDYSIDFAEIGTYEDFYEIEE